MFMGKKVYLVYSYFFLLFSFFFLMTFIYFKMSMNYYFEISFYYFNSMYYLMSFNFDYKSFMFLFTVSFISSSVFFFSLYYMYNDKNFIRFVYMVFLFIISMYFLIFSGNFISLLLGWDGLGLSSYCLVIFYQNFKCLNSGLITFITNRIGDVFILFYISLLLDFYNWSFFFFDYLNIFLLLLASVTKSAQFPFMAWLPEAMAAPTPVSSLVHSSTLVTAGVYLLIRCNNFVSMNILLLVFFFGLITCFISGLSAIFEVDLKKIVALSTLSQLGLMMMILGSGNANLCFFHLIIHAFFKSLLFVSVGFIMHSMFGNQDSRLMCNMHIYGPFICVMMIISNLSLCGFPFLAGFYSKDLILEYILLVNFNIFYVFMSFFSGCLTVLYSVRFMYMVLSYNLLMKKIFISMKMSMYMVMIYMNLFFMSIFFGFFFFFFVKWDFFVNIMFFFEKYYIFFICFFFIMIILYSYRYVYYYHFFFKKMMIFLMVDFFFINYLSKKKLKKIFLNSSFSLMKNFDFGFNEFYSGFGLKYFFLSLNWFFQKNQFLKYMNYNLFIGLFLLLLLMY